MGGTAVATGIVIIDLSSCRGNCALRTFESASAISSLLTFERSSAYNWINNQCNQLSLLSAYQKQKTKVGRDIDSKAATIFCITNGVYSYSFIELLTFFDTTLPSSGNKYGYVR